MAEIIARTGNILELTQTIETNIKGGYAYDILNLNDTVRSNFVFGDARNTLVMSSRSIVNTVLNLEASNELVLSQSTHPRVLVVEAHNYLILAQDLEIPIHGGANSAFTMTSLAECTVSKAASNTLTFTQEVTFELVNTVEASNFLALTQGATCYVS